MNKLHRNYVISILFFILILGGCREFEDIIVNFDGENISFTLPKDELQATNSFVLYDIAVTDEQCQQDCVYWEMVRESEPVPQLGKHFIQFPLIYGRVIDGMQVRFHKPIQQGQYSIVATFAVVKGGKITDSKTVHKSFFVK